MEVPEDDIDDIGEILEAAKNLFPGIDAEPEVKWTVHKLAFEVVCSRGQSARLLCDWAMECPASTGQWEAILDSNGLGPCPSTPIS